MRILILSHALELGGAERSLIGLLHALDPKKCQTDLFLLRHEGELLQQIPDHIHLLPQIAAYTVLARPMKDTLREGHLLLTLARLFGKLAAKCYNAKHVYTDSGVSLEYSHKYTCPLMPAIAADTEYDLAISFLTPHYFVAQKVRAKKKIAWIHTDYTQLRIDIPSETAMWACYDRIISISDTVSESFLKIFPGMQDKLLVMENILPAASIRSQADGDISACMPQDGSLRLLSVGRYCYSKNFDNIPDICARLRQQGLNVKWYIIGFGSDEALIRQRIQEAGMEQFVILLGKRDNPYPYIRACDLYVQPSRYEGKCITVREAQLLGRPVLISRYPTASSQVQDGVDGIIVPQDNAGCAAGIAALLRDPDTMARLAASCQSMDHSGASEVEKLYHIVR